MNNNEVNAIAAEWNHGLKPGNTVFHQKKMHTVMSVQGNHIRTYENPSGIHVAHLFDETGRSFARNVS